MTPPQERQGAVHFPDLDALRSIAFLFVFLDHGFGHAGYGLKVPVDPLDLFRQAFLVSGDVGVSIFFVLSGFLITFLLLKEQERHGKVDVLRFYMRRTLRVWPLFFLVVGLGALLCVAIGSPAVADLPYFFLFLGNFVLIGRVDIPVFLAVTWSVCIEEQFYVVWPQLIGRVRRHGQLVVIGAVMAVSVSYRFVNRDDGSALYYHSFSVMGDLAMGGLLAWLGINSERFVRGIASLSRGAILCAYAAGGLAVFGRHLVSYPLADPAMALALDVLSAVSRLLLATFFAFVIAEQAWGTRSWFKLRSSRPLSAMGKYTYGLYLLHPLAIAVGIGVATRAWLLATGQGAAEGGASAAPWVRPVLGLPLGLAVALLLSVTSYHLFERRFLLMKRRFTVVPSRNG